MKVKLAEAAEVVRSKNSGPYELTLDIIFRDWEMFERFCKAKPITSEVIAEIYKISPERVVSIVEFEPAKAIKVTLVRSIPSGDLGETDVYGAQQHAPLLALECEV